MLINAAGPSYTCVWVASLLVTVLHGIRLCMGCLHIRLLLSQPANTIEPCDALEITRRCGRIDSLHPVQISYRR